MRKLKLQMQLSVDGFVAGPKGEMDWMTWDIQIHQHNHRYIRYHFVGQKNDRWFC